MTTVSLVEDITIKVASLPMELQREVLDFIEFLSHKANNGAGAQSSAEDIAEARAENPTPPIRNVIGLFDHLGINITEEDIAEARREMWGNFPREEPR